MNHYPEAVAQIADDYVVRVGRALHSLPAVERAEFLAEIRSHVFEAYQRTEGPDEVARILAVLRNFGEPAEVVAGRLPAAMVRSGARTSSPLQILGGLLIALFGVPLGAGGVAVFMGVLAALAGLSMAFLATVAAAVLTSALCIALGLILIYQPELFTRLVNLGVIEMNAREFEIFETLTSQESGLLLVIAGSMLALVAFGLALLARRLARGLRVLFVLAFDRARKLAQRVRARFGAAPRAPAAAPAMRPVPAP